MTTSQQQQPATSVKPLVTVTGVTGYVGSNVASLLLESNRYRVRGTCRNKDSPATIAKLKESFGDKLFGKLELRNADLTDAESMMSALEGSEYVVHVASPISLGKDREKVVPPAVEGTIAAMKACAAAEVKRCVLTSSITAIFAVDPSEMPAGKVFDETIWSDPDSRICRETPYFESKTRAEMAAWNFLAALPDNKLKFELATICPAFIVGPVLKKGEKTPSVVFMRAALTGELKEVGSDHHPSVDVRDVARAHVLAMERKEAAGQRYVLCQGTPTNQDYVTPVADRFKPLGWPVSDNYVKKVEGMNGPLYFDNSKSRALGIDYILFDKTVINMAQSLIDVGDCVKP